MAAAVAARKLGRPVRVMLDRDEDMLMTGHRNPFMAKYRVGFNKDGIIKAVDVDIVSFDEFDPFVVYFYQFMGALHASFTGQNNLFNASHHFFSFLPKEIKGLTPKK